MKILWISNAGFTNTGYGVATNAVVPRLQEAGHEVIVLGYYGVQGGSITIDDITYVPAWHDQWANDCFEAYALQFGCDIAIIHRDAWVNPKRPYTIPVLSWTPLDCEPLPPVMYDAAKYSRWVATMSHHSVKQFEEGGLPAWYVPHSVNPDVFTYSRDRSARKQFAPRVPEDAFLVLIAGANKGFPSRKAFPEMFEALARLQAQHDDVWFHAHTEATNQNGGPDLQQLARVTGVDLGRGSFTHPMFYNAGVDEATMASMYQASDVLLNPSYGEGFGIPILEAQACGTPVITNNFGAMPELTWNGITAEGTPWLNALYSYWKRPYPDSIYASLELMYQRWKRPNERDIGKAEGVANTIPLLWSHDAVFQNYWKPLLNHIEHDLQIESGEEIAL